MVFLAGALMAAYLWFVGWLISVSLGTFGVETTLGQQLAMAGLLFLATARTQLEKSAA